MLRRLSCGTIFRSSFLAFASGLTAGLLTLWVLFFNGLMIGTLTGLTAFHGIGFELWTFVIGHGVIELSIIFISGGSGLMLGWAILRPGLMRRRDALRPGCAQSGVSAARRGALARRRRDDRGLHFPE